MPFKITSTICMILCALGAVGAGAAFQFGLDSLGTGVAIAAGLSLIGALALYLNSPYDH